MSERLLDVSALVAGYGGSEVLHGVDLHVEPGETVGVIGPNGAGKSTLLATLAGAHQVRDGQMSFDGHNAQRWSAARRVRHGLVLVPEGRQVFAPLTVQENLWLGGFSRRRDRSTSFDLVYELFPRLRERAGQAAGTLSGGEQQMLAIGRGLMAGPELLMIDEPSLGLAPVLVEAMTERLTTIATELGVAMLIAEQGVNVAADTCDRIYVLAGGRTVAEVTADVSEHRLLELYMGAAAPPPRAASDDTCSDREDSDDTTGVGRP